MKHLTVRKLRDELNRLIECGMGDRAVSFPVCEYDEGWSGDYLLVGRVDTRDALEVAVYLKPLSVQEDTEEWNIIEEEGNRRLDDEEEDE